ncbi:putative mitogen-activated protein kinase kinase kinase 7-like [Drosophila busckii]|uniref:putative mitogen-activated protein kinase kinase kinase 7-like n=1 Tax=Drosophila busckii TaxID=30019 RepID=UPI001432D2CB|nr:putative mitogen-activated protein kinase kinase kinase 7-like [Drosophila busckii]XP_033150345.1 putative mitogen-activated protein kinase kinase kinase 7-like [Drosophila busckii]
MYQCAKGLAYLHGRQPQIMHGDVKTTNLVISNSKLLKICDFGDIKAAASNNWLKGTDEYRAPEIYKSPDFYDEKCDAYSFGIVLWEVMAQKIPFENWDTHKIRAEVSNNNVRPDINAVKKSEISEDIKILIKLCWHVDPKGRPSMKSMEGMLFMSLSIRLKGTAPGMYSIVDPTEIKLLKKLGQGSYGEVFKASWSPRSLSMTYAVKRISYVDEKCKQDVEKEALLLTSVSHDNIIKLYGISHDTSPLGNRILLLMEYAENGSLEAYIHSGRNFAYDDLLNLMRQCVKALAYLHGCEPKIMHRDVKTANMVLTSDYRKLKICDFGLVKSVATKNTEQIGSIPYRAPEIYNTNKYDEKCDVYSFGIVLWEVMSQRQPFENCEIANIMYQVLLDKKRPDINAVNGHQMSNHIKLIITKCWEEDPKARPSMKDLESILQFLC